MGGAALTDHSPLHRLVTARPAERHLQALYGKAVHRRARSLRRRTVARRLMWLLLCAASVAFLVWAMMARPWVEPPSQTTPPYTGW